MSDALRARLTALDAALQAYGYSALPCAQCRRAGSITVHDLHDLLAALLREPPEEKSLTVQEALTVLFELTGAESLELHSGDREPGRYITRESVLKARAAAPANVPASDLPHFDPACYNCGTGVEARTARYLCPRCAALYAFTPDGRMVVKAAAPEEGRS